MNVDYQNKSYRITVGGITMVENALENPNLIQISVMSDCIIEVAKNDKYGISYQPNGDYRYWDIDGLNTRLNKADAHFIYIRANRADNRSLIVFSVNDYAIDGSINGENPSEDYYYFKVGSITETDKTGPDAEIARSIFLDFGKLATPEQLEQAIDLGDFFELADGKIIAKYPFVSLTTDTIYINGSFVLNEKPVMDIARKADGDNFLKNDTTIPTTAFLYYTFLEEVDDMYLRKDIDDTAHGIILFDKKIGSSEYIEGWDGIGWEIESDGSAELEALRVRSDIYLGGRLGSDTFVSGFPNGYGWEITPYKRTNAAGVEETKYKLEIDDISVRGTLRAYEFVISQMRGENDNYIFAGMMRVDHYDPSTRRIYLDTEEGVLYNPFKSGDILMVQRFGGIPTEENDYSIIKQYELQVDEAGIGSLSDGEERLDWITFTNFTGDIEDIASRDILVRVDSATDSTRKGVVTVTTINETGAPYIDVVYGMKTDPENATKARMGNLTGIRTKNRIDLTGVWGIYGNGAYFENSTYILDNGNTVEQQFSIMNGQLNSLIGEVRNDMSLEEGNILVNSTFSKDTNYWVTDNEVHFYALNGVFLWDGDAFMSEKGDIADITSDGGRNVLRIRNSKIYQENGVMNIPVRPETPEGDEAEEYTYSFSFYYKAVTAGTLSAGIEATGLWAVQELQPAEGYQKFSKTGKWDETGDFSIAYTGEIYIYGASLFNDALADAEIRLQTQITQNAEQIALRATKEYVDSETGKIYEKYNAELSVMADDISLRVTYEDFEDETNRIETSLESQISVQAGKITANSTAIDNINNEIDTAGWITTAEGNTLFAKKEMEDGNTIVSAINQSATTVKISANRVDISGVVTFSMLDSSLKNTINGKLDSGDVGDLAFKDTVTSNELSYSLYNQIMSAIDLDALNERLGNYTQKGQITEADLSAAFQDVIDGKLSGSVTTSAGKIASAVINGQTLISGGYIQAEYINVDELVATNIEATTGSIGAFDIDDYGLINEAANPTAYIKIGNEADEFIYMNGDYSHSMLSVRSENKDYAVYLQAYGTDTSALSIIGGSTNGYAIDSSGSHRFYQASNKTWSAPGVLTALKVNGSGTVISRWGNGLNRDAIVNKRATGTYRVTHNLGWTTYYVAITGLHATRWSMGQIIEHSSNYFDYQMVDPGSGVIDSDAFIMIFGRNKITD